MPDGDPAPDEYRTHHLDLLNAVHAFTEAARAHLNDDATPRRR
jgi:hypothetical protein